MSTSIAFVAMLSVTSGGDQRTSISGWGLAAFGFCLLLTSLVMVRVVGARDIDGEPKYIPQGSYAFKLGLSVLLAVAGLALLVIGVVQAMI